MNAGLGAVEGKKVVVVGGGPAGLTLARLLQMQGADVGVYERDTDRNARLQGSALDLHENSGLAALQAAGLMDGFWKWHRADLNRLRLTDHRLRVLYDFDRSRHVRPEIERVPLRNLLLDALKPDTVRWNKKLSRAAEDGACVRLEFADGETVIADLAVGADGVNSKLRALVTPVRPEYVGVTLVEGIVPEAETKLPDIWTMLGGSALMALGERQTMGMATKSSGSVLFYAGLRAPEGQVRESLADTTDGESQQAWFHEHFPQWSERWAPLFAHSIPLLARPLYSCPTEQHWTANPRVTVIGDAAHVMPPYAGEGVNMAMLDALVLSRELLGQTDAGTAIAAYEREMFARMAEVMADTLANTKMFYARDAAEQVVGMFQSFAGTAVAEAAAMSAMTEG